MSDPGVRRCAQSSACLSDAAADYANAQAHAYMNATEAMVDANSNGY